LSDETFPRKRLRETLKKTKNLSCNNETTVQKPSQCLDA
jgi:hypothetical protein